MKHSLLLISLTVALACGPGALAQKDDKPAAKAAPIGAVVKNLDANESEKLLKENTKVIVLDVRTSAEFDKGRLKGAKNIDFLASDFQKKLETLEKGESYLVHCASGRRSAQARDLMKSLGFKSIYHMEGGLTAWEKAGKPVEH